MRHFIVARFLQGPGGDASEHVHRVNASSAMGERCLMGIQFQGGLHANQSASEAEGRQKGSFKDQLQNFKDQL